MFPPGTVRAMSARERGSASLGPAAAYERHVGRYGAELAEALIAVTGVRPGMRALDVGCGPGALTVALADLLAGESVCAVDPSEAFVGACRSRVPTARVVKGVAEELPFSDAEFDVVLAQLVLNHLSDVPRGVREMRRVARPGAIVAASVWDFASGMPMLRNFWDAARSVDPGGATRAGAGRRPAFSEPEQLRKLWREAGFGHVEVGTLQVGHRYDGFEDFWASFEAGYGASGRYLASLDGTTRRALRREVQRRLGAPEGPFELGACARYVRGFVPAQRR
jgi:SAM-dependent methyltransferase